MLNLLNTEFYKLFHSRYFWGIVAFNLFLSSVLLLDSIGETSSLFFASLYNVPILFFLAIVFSALFVGNDFGQRTLQSYIIAGHNRGQILLAKLIAYQIACITILALPLLVHGLIGRLCFKESFVSVSGNLYTVLAVVVSSLPECNFEVRYVDSVLLNPCAEYQRLLRMGKVARIAANFSEYIANEPKVSYRDGRYFVFDGQNTIEARKTCNGGRDLPIRCKVFYGLSKEHEALLFAVQTGISSELTAGEQLRAKLVAHEENACDFVSVTEDTGVRFALDGIRAPWKIYCIRSAYYIYKSYGASLYREMLSVLVDAWGGDSDSFLSGILHGMARFLALYQGEYSRERLILRLRTVHPKTITRLAQNDTGNVADRHMKQILSIYNGAGRTHNLPCKR